MKSKVVKVSGIDILFSSVGADSTPAAGFQFYRILFYLTRMSDDEFDNANSEQPLSDAPHYVWQYFAVTIILIMMLRKAGQRMLSVHFVTKVSVDVARSEQQHIS